MAFLRIDPDIRETLSREGLSTFEDFHTFLGGEVIGGHPARNVTRVDLGTVRGYLKREQRSELKDRLASWWGGFGFVSKSRREWNVLHALRAAGIACPEPLAVGECGRRAFLLIRELAGMCDLPVYLEQHATSPFDRSRVARDVGRALARFHAAGFTHPDLYAKHVFVHTEDASICFIDYQRTRRRRWVSWGQRWRDLAALDASLNESLASARDRLIGLVAYLRAVSAGDVRRLLRRSVCAITRRTRHLVGRRKVQEMRQRTGSYAVHFYRLAAPADRPQETSGTATGSPRSPSSPGESHGRW